MFKVIFEVILLFLVLLTLITQVIVPLVIGTPLFSFFRADPRRVDPIVEYSDLSQLKKKATEVKQEREQVKAEVEETEEILRQIREHGI